MSPSECGISLNHAWRLMKINYQIRYANRSGRGAEALGYAVRSPPARAHQQAAQAGFAERSRALQGHAGA
jgi:hypothetical protein